MTNEQKAREYLLKEHISPLNNILHQCDLKTEFQYHKDIENAFIKGAEWKDEQFAKEKQQWIEKAVDFISKRFYIGINNHVTSKEDYYSLTELIRDFEQTMKGV